MKMTIAIVAMLFCSIATNAQTAITSAGGNFSSSAFNMTYAVGDIAPLSFGNGVFSTNGGCLNSSSYNTSVGVGEELVGPSFSAYPNPMADNLFVECEGEFTVQIFNLTGEQVITQAINGNATISTSNLAAGLYIFTITSKTGVQSTRKLIKR